MLGAYLPLLVFISLVGVSLWGGDDDSDETADSDTPLPSDPDGEMVDEMDDEMDGGDDEAGDGDDDGDGSDTMDLLGLVEGNDVVTLGDEDDRYGGPEDLLADPFVDIADPGFGMDDDLIAAGGGDDQLIDPFGANTLLGGLGDDVIVGRDVSIGDDTPDVLSGEEGDDALFGDSGDILSGGEGVDAFNVIVPDTTSGAVRVTDWETGEVLAIHVPTADDTTILETSLSADGLDTEVLLDGRLVALVEGVTSVDPAAVVLIPADGGAAEPEDTTSLAGVDAGSMADILEANGLTGGPDADTITPDSNDIALGGEGADRFVSAGGVLLEVGGAAPRIDDFTPGEDQLDLSEVVGDADLTDEVDPNGLGVQVMSDGADGVEVRYGTLTLFTLPNVAVSEIDMDRDFVLV